MIYNVAHTTAENELKWMDSMDEAERGWNAINVDKNKKTKQTDHTKSRTYQQYSNDLIISNREQ